LIRALALLVWILPLPVLAQVVDTPADPGAAPAGEPRPVLLADVLASVEAHYPLLAAARAERGVAAGKLQSARGSFDTRLVADGDLRPAGFYENYAGGGKLEQLTRLWGLRLFGGYKVGSGTFPSYEGDRQTNRAGEVGGGVELPLLRGRSIDDARAKLRRAELERLQVEPKIALEVIDFFLEATLAYWNWLAAGLEVDVARDLLRVATARQQQLEGRVARGLVPRIDLVDNERLIVDRRIRLRGAERDAEQAAIALSLFLRDGGGEPRLVPSERLPEGFPEEVEPDPGRVEADVTLAREAHPLLASLALERQRMRVELALARNDRLPDVDLLVEASQDYGTAIPGVSSKGSVSPNPRGETEVKARIRFQLPIQQRDARGRITSATARLARLESRQQFERERIEADIRRAMAGLEAAYAQAVAARDNLTLARELQRAEERKLGLGASNLIDVNIREQQAADAGVSLIEAQADYFRALARYQAAVAVGF